MILRLLALMFLLLPMTLGMAGPATAQVDPPEPPRERVIAGLSEHRVALTTTFTGSEIFIYGAVSREAPAPPGELDVIVVVIGPSEPVVVRKKVQRFGIWVNGPSVTVNEAPSFYAVSTSGDFREVVGWTDDMRYRIGLDHAIRLISPTQSDEYPEDFRRAVIRLRHAEGLYFEQQGGVNISEETLFETRVRLPANLVEGDYVTRIFLLRDREVIDWTDDTIAVRRAGLGRIIYTMAQEQGALYGVISIAVALAAGWFASAFFRFFFP